MKAMVLAAGQGTRLRPLTDTQPKALVPVGGRPMIEYSLLLLRHYGIRDVVINLHHHGEQIENRLADGSQLGLQISYSIEPELLDTGGGLLKAKPFFAKRDFHRHQHRCIDRFASRRVARISPKATSRGNVGFAA